jgi:hypothetical protein
MKIVVVETINGMLVAGVKELAAFCLLLTAQKHEI